MLTGNYANGHHRPLVARDERENGLLAPVLAGTPSGFRPLTGEVRRARIRELALRAGLILPPISSLDHEDVKSELTGAAELDQRNALLAARRVPAISVIPAPTVALESVWTDTELDDSIVRLCDEFPDARMASCSRALEYCRRSTPRGTPESLLTEMRDTLRLDMERTGLPFAA